MSANLALILTAAATIGCGVYLILERSLTQVLVGIVLMGNGVNILFLVASGPAGGAPIVGEGPVEEMADPLPQALVLTAIVITLAVTAFLLAMAHRSWQLNQHDDVQDDVEDAVDPPAGRGRRRLRGLRPERRGRRRRRPSRRRAHEPPGRAPGPAPAARRGRHADAGRAGRGRSGWSA